MKLKDLFLVIPEDYAIRPIANNPLNLPTFDPIYSKIVGSQDNIDVWGSREKKGFEIFGFKNLESVIAYIILEEDEVVAQTVRLRELWVKDDQRGKGLATGLLIFVTRKLKIKLLIDRNEIVSADARSLVKKAVDRGILKVAINKNITLDVALTDLTKNDIEIVLFETARSKLFGAQMQSPDGRITFAEHAVINVGEASDFD